jgi:hypothetical protein
MTSSAVGMGTGALQGMGDAPTVEAGIPQAGMGGLLGGALGPAALIGLSTGGNVMSALGSKMRQDWAGDVARRRIATAFERDTTTADDVGRRMVQLGQEARIVDAAGENTRSALDLNAILPGMTKELLEQTIRNRQATSFDRLNDSVIYALSGGYGRAKDITKALTEQQKNVAGPLYQKAHAQSIVADPDLIAMLDAAKSLGAFKQAKTIATAERTNFTLDQLQQGQPVSIRDIDYIKRGLDGLIDNATEVGGRPTTMSRAYTGLKSDLMDKIDTLAPDFAAARQAFAGPAELKSAVEKGRKFWREEPANLSDEMAGMTQSEQEAFRVGAAEALRLKIGSEGGRTELLGMWKNNNIQERIKALLGDDVKYADVQRMVNNEGVLKRLQSLGRGSQTAARQFANQDQNAGVAGDLASMALDAKTGIGSMILRGLKKAGSGEVLTPEPVRDAMGRILLQQYQPAEMQALLKAQEVIRRQRALASGAAGIAGGKASSTVSGGLLD